MAAKMADRLGFQLRDLSIVDCPKSDKLSRISISTPRIRIGYAGAGGASNFSIWKSEISCTIYKQTARSQRLVSEGEK